MENRMNEEKEDNMLQRQSVMTDSAGFTHLSSSPPASETDLTPERCVEFHNMKTLYSPEKDLICTFSACGRFKISDEDSIALCPSKDKSPPEIFKKVPVNPKISVGDGIKYYIVTFKVEDLPQDWNFYKLCYTSRNKVVATSAPFRFGYPVESEFIEVEDPHDPGLVVFKSRVAESNEIIAKLKEEKAELVTKCNLNEESISLLRREILKLEAALTHLHGLNRNLNDNNKSLKQQLIRRQLEVIPTSLIQSKTLAPIVPDLNIMKSDISEIKNIVSCIQNSLAENEDLSSFREAVDNITSSLNDLKQNLTSSEVKNPERSESPVWIISSSESNAESEEAEEELGDYSSAETEEFPEESAKDLPCSSSDENPKIEVQACLSNVIKENEALSKELGEIKEINAFLRSRVGVLELEIFNMNEKKYQLLMSCITAYEQENAALKEKLDKLAKDECQTASLLKQIDYLTQENRNLKAHIREGMPSIDPLVRGLQNDLNKILLEKDNLKQQLMELRKQTVGKVSLHMVSSSSASPVNN